MAKTIKRLLTAALAMLLLCQMLLLVACKGGDPIQYTVTVKTEAGAPMVDIGVYVYTDSTKAELVWFSKTDAAGTITFEAEEKDGYVAVLADVPDGYQLAETYALAGAHTDIVLATALQTDVDLSTVTKKLGDVMFDFTITDTDGKEHKLSQLLEEKQAVVLNFWYTACGPCKAEFPFLQEAYKKYSDSVEVLALNPVDKDATKVADFKKELGLTFPMAVCDAQWERIFNLTAYPTTVVIDRYGVISLIHSGSIDTTQAFEDIFATYVDDDYTQTVVDDIDKVTVNAAGKTLEFGGVTTFDVTLEPGEAVKCNVYKVSGMYMELKSPHAQVVYGDKTYDPENGVIGFTVYSDSTYNPVVLTIGNTSKEKQTFTVNFSHNKGTQGNPYTLSLGEFTAKIAADNDQGIYYNYTATQNGTLTLSYLSGTAGVKYGIVLYNLDTYANRTLEEDGSKDAAGKPCVSVAMNKGNTVQVTVATLPDDENKYPAGECKLKAAFAAGAGAGSTSTNTNVNYSITVKDTAGKAVAGAVVHTTVNGQTKQFAADKNGVATASLPKGDYTFTLSVPTGYTASTTTLKLTASKTTGTFTVAKKSTAQITYTVTVKDAAGKAVSGASVIIGSQYGTTDKNGKVSLKLVSDTYQAYVSADGYETPSPVTLTASAPNATVTLKKASSGGTTVEKKTYTVTVVDAETDAPQTNVMVQFLQNGTQKAMQKVDAKGVATVELPAGNYTVSIAGTNRGFDRNAAVLTANSTSVRIALADKLSGEPVFIEGTGNIYPLTVGATYTQLSKDAVNYFYFTPTEPGLYQFSTSHASAKLSYQGGSFHFIRDLTESTDMKNNTFTQNVSENHLGSDYILGVTGADECILYVTRIGDYVQGIEDKPWSEDWMKDGKPKAYKLTIPSGKKLINVDITASTSTYKLVYNKTDGYYHLNSASGPVLLVRLGEDAPNLSMKVLLDNTGLKKYFFGSDGSFIKKEDYTQRMLDYVAAADSKTGVYPVTKDMMYIFQQYGEYAGWWNGSEGSLLNGYKNLNKEIAWMFACCYVG